MVNALQRVGLLGVCIFLIGSCGFQPRGHTLQNLEWFSPIALSGRPTHDPFMRILEQQLLAAGATLVSSKEKAKTLIHIQSIKQKSSVFSVNSSNKAVEHEIEYRVIFDIEHPPGTLHLVDAELTDYRIVYAPGGALLGRIREAEMQKVDVYRGLAQRLVERLSHLAD